MNHSTFLHIQLFHDDYLNNLMLPDDPDEDPDDEGCDTSADWPDLKDTLAPSVAPSRPRIQARR